MDKFEELKDECGQSMIWMWPEEGSGNRTGETLEITIYL